MEHIEIKNSRYTAESFEKDLKLVEALLMDSDNPSVKRLTQMKTFDASPERIVTYSKWGSDLVPTLGFSSYVELNEGGTYLEGKKTVNDLLGIIETFLRNTPIPDGYTAEDLGYRIIADGYAHMGVYPFIFAVQPLFSKG